MNQSENESLKFAGNLLNEQFSLNGKLLGDQFSDYISWIFESEIPPLIRGSIIEYLIVRHLLSHCEEIAGASIKKKSGFDVGPAPDESYRRSLVQTYKSQPHGDVFDFQFHWGMSVEIKSTTEMNNFRIAKTQAWNPCSPTAPKLSIFPAQAYIVVEIDKEYTANTFNIREIYVSSGRKIDDLLKKNIKPNDTCSHGNKSISGIELRSVSKQATIDSLGAELRTLFSTELSSAIRSIPHNYRDLKFAHEICERDGDWMPVAWKNEQGVVELGMSKSKDRGQWADPVPLKNAPKNLKLDWRLIEALGFKYLFSNNGL